MLSRIKNRARRFIGQCLCAVLDGDRLDDLLRACLRDATQEAMETVKEDIRIDEDEVIEAIVGTYRVDDDEVIRGIASGYEVDESAIAETIIDNIDLRDIRDAVVQEIDTHDLTDEIQRELEREIRQEVVEGLFEDGKLTADITDEAVKVFCEGKHLSALAVHIADILEQRAVARQNAVEAIRTTVSEVMQTAREEAR